ncbi:MAG: glucosyltransferase domain-containing protein [Pantoea sp.]|uniref:Glucosyl transferase GtrII family protein n=1 Tax=Pantoea septica TaxID=472695 RepID=A0ABX3UV58_9GAMM|nr:MULTISPECIES: glucosyltransferase domain-containing protein [Pantoea]MDU5780280.1 glucosyltransferase domain-containing protein [Pantoea sp.]ORN01965.1 hypothetical protein HA46_04845 [Pantoea septica]
MLAKTISLGNEELKKYRYIFIAALVSYILIFGFELTHFTLSIDEELMDNFHQTLSLGRWGHALLRKYILPEPYIPFFTLILSILILSVSSVIASVYLDLSTRQSVIFVIMLAAIPQMAYQLEFSNQADTIAISVLCSVLSLTLLNRLSIVNAVSFVLLTVASLSIYQSIFLYAASLLMVWVSIGVFRGNLNFIKSLKICTIFLFLVIISLIINSYVSVVVSSHYNVAISDYLSDRMGWKIAPTHTIIMNIIGVTRDYLTFNAEYGMNAFPFSVLFLLASVAGAFYYRKNPILTSVVLVLTFFSAFSLNFALGMRLPPRTMTQIPVVFAGLFIMAVLIFRLNVSALVIALMFLLTSAASSNRLFYTDYMARKADDHLATRIVVAIQQEYPTVDIDNTPIFFYGSYTPYNQWSLANSDIFGRSFFSQDKGNNTRMNGYLSISNIIKVKRPNPEQVAMAREAGADLPSWPNKGSVSMVNGVLIVKLSNELSKYNN